MTIRLIVWTGIRNLEIIISQFNPFNKCSASIPKYESVIFFLRCRPVIILVISFSLTECIMPEAIFKSYRVTFFSGTFASVAVVSAFPGNICFEVVDYRNYYCR